MRFPDCFIESIKNSEQFKGYDSGGPIEPCK
jgi:hypothetical protein